MDIRIRQAIPEDASAVTALLTDAARWVEQLDGTTMWVEHELAEDRIAAEVDAGLFYVAECDGDIVGALKFQLDDQSFWPDLATDDSAFIHRLALSGFRLSGFRLAVLSVSHGTPDRAQPMDGSGA